MCLSKPAMERAASAERVAPRSTAKETRAALIAHVGAGTYVHPAARFAPSAAELAVGGARFRPAAGDGTEPDRSEDGGELDGSEAAPDDDVDGQDEAGGHGAVQGVPPGRGSPMPCQPTA